MPWVAMSNLEVDSSVPPSFMSNNLSSDGDGRLAFVQGNRVRCTKRISVSQGRNDFTLAYSEKMDVTSVHWWIGVERYNRPLLVMTTESSSNFPATLQIWNVGRGTGTRILRCHVNELEKEDFYDGHGNIKADLKPIQFARGLAQASSGPMGQLLFCGTSNGSVFGIEYKKAKGGEFNRICTLRDLSHPVVALAGDRKESDLLAGSDEAGNLVVWRIEEELDRDASNNENYRATVLYRYFQQDDFFTSIAIRGSIVIAGHASGYVTFHDMELKMLLASVVTNTKAVTCIDIYEGKNLALVCGEDGRVSVLGFAERRGFRPVIHFSFAFDSILIGGAFSNLKGELPKIAMLAWEKCNLLQFVYKRSKIKEKGQRSLEAQRDVKSISTSGAQEAPGTASSPMINRE